MQKHRVGSVIVNKKNGKEIPVSERDLLNKILPLQVSLDEYIGKFCTTPLITSDHKTISTAEAVKIMLSNNIKRLPLKENHGIYSILTARDLVEAWSK
jgi:signal-transduction protein with cAMP-binding, CBS, and nucleotidyltransferase domain